MNLVEGPDALVGFRPEHFLPPEAHRAGDELVTLPIRVHRQEYLGADRLVYGTPEARFREARVISRLPSTVTTAVMVGDRQDFAVRVGDLKFFDRQSGRRTTPRPL
jgi:multiple sugar transport system ATP-binding protein